MGHKTGGQAASLICWRPEAYVKTAKQRKSSFSQTIFGFPEQGVMLRCWNEAKSLQKTNKIFVFRTILWDRNFFLFRLQKNESFQRLNITPWLSFRHCRFGARTMCPKCFLPEWHAERQYYVCSVALLIQLAEILKVLPIEEKLTK